MRKYTEDQQKFISNNVEDGFKQKDKSKIKKEFHNKENFKSSYGLRKNIFSELYKGNFSNKEQTDRLIYAAEKENIVPYFRAIVDMYVKNGPVTSEEEVNNKKSSKITGVVEFGKKEFQLLALAVVVVPIVIAGSLFIYSHFGKPNPQFPPLEQKFKPEKVVEAIKPPGSVALHRAYEHEKAGNEPERVAALLYASQEGNPTAELELEFSSYRFGSGSELEIGTEDTSKRLDLIRRAKEGDAKARYLYGLGLMQGRLMKKDPSEAYAQLASAFRQGEIRAAKALAILILENEEIVPENKRIALKCEGFSYAMQAEKDGHMIAKWIVARYLKQHACPAQMGTKQQATRNAISRLTIAADKHHHAESQNMLGVMYKEGIGFGKNDESDDEAFRLFKLASDQGNTDAINNLGVMYANNRGVNKSEENDKDAVDQFKRTADLNDARGQYSLGWMYMKDRVGDDKNADDEAFRLFDLAVSQGYVSAKVDLAWLYRHGRGVEKNYKEALRLYEEAAREGDNLAKVNLGYMYLSNLGMPKSDENKRIAFEYYKRAAEESAQAQYQLGRMYLHNEGVPEGHDIEKKAFDWFRKSAEQDYPPALNSLGILYQSGRGVTKDLHTALMYYEKAATLANSSAMANLGWLYTSNEVVARNYEKSLFYFSEVEQAGDLHGTAAVGWLYANGYGVDENHEEAYRRFSEAAKAGDEYAQYYLGQAYRLGKISKEIDYDKAADWYRKAEKQGYAKAQVGLGVLYELGQGVPQDDEEAVRLYRAAADQGNEEGITRLGRMYKYGRGVPENEENDKTAETLFRKAANNGYYWAQYQLGLMYKSGRGVPDSPENDRLAFEWFQKASNQDYGYAQFELAQMYAEKSDVPTDVDADTKALELFKEALPSTGMWELRKFAKWNTLFYKRDDFKALAQENLERYIGEKNKKELSVLFGNNPWFYLWLRSEIPNDIEYSLHPCDAAIYYWCFDYSSKETVEKVNSMSQLGVWEATFTLIFYYNQQGNCNEANNYLRLALNNIGNSSNRFKYELFDVLYAMPVEVVCHWDIDMGMLLNGVLEAAYEGYENADFGFGNAMPQQVVAALKDLYPSWIAKFEKKSIEDANSDWWSTLGSVYAVGGPGIHKQPKTAEAWFMRAVNAGDTYSTFQLAELYVNDFSPSRISDAINLINANNKPNEAIEELERLRDRVRSGSDKLAIILTLNEAIADLKRND